MKCAFLDRDGVINFDHGYVGSWERFEIFPNTIEGLKLLQSLGYSLFVVTNQSGIARGYYSQDQFLALDQRMKFFFKSCGVHIKKTYFCPHHPTEGDPPLRKNCRCRKPMPGLIEQCARDYDVDLANSIMIGDKISDYHAGTAAGVGQIFLVDSHYLESVSSNDFDASISKDILEVAQKLGSKTSGRKL